MNGDLIIGMVAIGRVGDGGEVEGRNVASAEEARIRESGDDLGGGEVVATALHRLLQETPERVRRIRHGRLQNLIEDHKLQQQLPPGGRILKIAACSSD